MQGMCPSMTRNQRNNRELAYIFCMCVKKGAVNMNSIISDEQKAIIQPVIESKLEEFHLIGYEDVTEVELWAYLNQKKWKKRQEFSLHQVVSDVLTVKITDVMSYVTIESYKSNMFETVSDNEDWKELLK